MERLRLILLKSKEKTNRTKLHLMDSSLKSHIHYSKSSSIFERSEYSTLSNRCNSRPEMSIQIPERPEGRRRRPFISERPTFPVANIDVSKITVQANL